MLRLFVLPSALETASAPGDWLSRLNGWPMHSPYRRFVAVLADANARLRADVDRYSFIVVDLHTYSLPVSRRTSSPPTPARQSVSNAYC
jgi:hypothetical protein